MIKPGAPLSIVGSVMQDVIHRRHVVERYRACFGSLHEEDYFSEIEGAPLPVEFKVIVEAGRGIMRATAITPSWVVSPLTGRHYAAVWAETRAWGWESWVWMRDFNVNRFTTRVDSRPRKIQYVSPYLENAFIRGRAATEVAEELALTWIQMTCEGVKLYTNPDMPLTSGSQRWT